MTTVLTDLTLLPGRGADPIPVARIQLDDSGVITAIEPGAGSETRFLVPAGVDLHLDNFIERRRPRASVVLDLATVVAAMDAECAAAGIGTVCVAARCEESPGKGVIARDAVILAEVVQKLHGSLACDWRLHARVEITDQIALETLAEVLQVSDRVALVSMMEHTINRSRFGSEEATIAYYAEDWGKSVEETAAIFAAKTLTEEQRRQRRAQVAELARKHGIPLASHDDREPGQVDDAHRLGARIAEFPLSAAAAERAGELGMFRVLGAPNAMRGKSTSPGNLLVGDATRAGLVDGLCTDYLPISLYAGAFALADRGEVSLVEAVDLVSTGPADVLGLEQPEIAVGQPLTAVLLERADGALLGRGLWRSGVRTFMR
ncbi:alpha-D-ribose 1-methylphosphonate 5-triphosphate diphosphatase [Enemella sp. A6]|uniref:alpha-D-ribose 1-methylphosphonate 5-triphosphate diphosphatase n=1 Tax=Enemella sp. A6 TaxID=3440152 RepID=UPI003EBFE971